MYYLSQSELALVIAYSLVVGIFLGVLWDFFRIMRLARGKYSTDSEYRFIRMWNTLKAKISDVLCFFEDMLFFTAAAVVVCIFLYHANSGKIRGIALSGSLMGFILYYCTVGRLVNAVAEKIINAVRYVLNFLFRHSVLPVCRLLCKLMNYILQKIRKKRLTNQTESYIKKMYDIADNGFGLTDCLN